MRTVGWIDPAPVLAEEPEAVEETEEKEPEAEEPAKKAASKKK